MSALWSEKLHFTSIYFSLLLLKKSRVTIKEATATVNESFTVSVLPKSMQDKALNTYLYIVFPQSSIVKWIVS